MNTTENILFKTRLCSNEFVGQIKRASTFFTYEIGPIKRTSTYITYEVGQIKGTSTYITYELDR